MVLTVLVTKYFCKQWGTVDAEMTRTTWNASKLGALNVKVWSCMVGSTVYCVLVCFLGLFPDCFVSVSVFGFVRIFLSFVIHTGQIL